MTILISIGAFIVVLGVLVTIHEYGHYLVARMAGVRVLRFSIGFGRALWRRVDRDGVEWVIAAIPLGGYVKFLDERDPDAPKGDMRGAFNRTSPWRKIAIVLAGPAANFLFAIVAYWAMFVIGIPGFKPVIGAVTPDTPAAHAGLEAGDELRRIDGERTPTWDAAILALLDAVIGDEPFAVTVAGPDGIERHLSVDAGPPRDLTEPGAMLPGLGIEPWRPRLEPVIGEVESGGAASRAGLRSGDRVIALDGERIDDWLEMAERVRASAGHTVIVTVERGGTRMEVPVTVATTDGGVGRLGVAPAVDGDPYAEARSELAYGPVAALGHGALKTFDMTWLTLRMLGRMLTGDVSVKHISGPISIAQYAGYSAAAGVIKFLTFMAIISISLGIVNLLPIPVLDGGHLLYHLAELVSGRPVSERTESIGQQVGLGLLAMLMGLAFYNDLARIFG